MEKLIFFLVIVLTAALSKAQNNAKPNLDLQDVNIRGEANKAGLGISSRAKNTLDGRIFIRKDFRDRIVEELPEYLKESSAVSGEAAKK